ncbi:MAG: dockerin type I repeat-containing protein [Armatimonadetes bacterium]|nr:dockerin type I repeat-containing protein [Armatimonadota bacterium]
MLLVGLAGIVFCGSTHAAALLRGDLTRDGQVNVSDATRVLRVTVGLATPESDDILAGDVDPVPGTRGRAFGDGSLTVGDAVRILRYSVELIGAAEFYGGEPATLDLERLTLQLHTRPLEQALFYSPSGTEASLSLNGLGASGLRFGGATVVLTASEGAPPLSFLRVERGELLPEGSEILANLPFTPIGGVTTARVAFSVAQLAPVQGYGELIRLIVKPLGPVPPTAVYTVSIRNPDFADDEANTVPVTPVEKKVQKQG